MTGRHLEMDIWAAPSLNHFGYGQVARCVGCGFEWFDVDCWGVCPQCFWDHDPCRRETPTWFFVDGRQYQRFLLPDEGIFPDKYVSEFEPEELI